MHVLEDCTDCATGNGAVSLCATFADEVVHVEEGYPPRRRFTAKAREARSAKGRRTALERMLAGRPCRSASRVCVSVQSSESVKMVVIDD